MRTAAAAPFDSSAFSRALRGEKRAASAAACEEPHAAALLKKILFVEKVGYMLRAREARKMLSTAADRP